MKPLKLSIGIRPSRPMFRFSTLSGNLIDDLLLSSERNKSTKGIFQHVQQDSEKSHFRLVGDECSFLVGTNDVQFTVDVYESKQAMDFDVEVERFISFFSTVNMVLKIQDIRRIGLVCEYRVQSKTELSSRELIEKTTKFQTEGFPAKFQLSFEQRHPITASTGLPDFRTDDFWNVIESYYDGEVDVDHSAPKQINLMLDVQRYYNPLLKEKVDAAIRAVGEKYKKQFTQFSEKAKTLGLLNGN